MNSQSNAMQIVQELGRKAGNGFMFYSLEVALIVLGPLMFFFSEDSKSGSTWGITVRFGTQTFGFTQHLWQLGWIFFTLFLWWGAYYLWKSRHDGFFPG